MTFRLPRVVVAGLAGSTGKTLVAVGLLRAFARRGIGVSAFKKGPDFIDVAWLGAASGRVAHNLDTFLMDDAALSASLGRARGTSITVIEGNRGLFDGVDARGSHSTAELSKRIQAPVLLVIDVSKSTRTVAAMALGCLALEPELPLGGIILNRVGTKRQESLIREALGGVTDVPVLGAIPRLPVDLLPSRHLGLVMPHERRALERLVDVMADAIESAVDVAGIERLAQSAPDLETADVAHSPICGMVAPGAEGSPPQLRDSEYLGWASDRHSMGRAAPRPPGFSSERGVRLGVLRDEAFSFYYSENLEALEAAGAILVPISPLWDESLPEVDALYAGGGYPEEHAAALSANAALREALRSRIDEGLPVWAECGGLMYLATELVRGDSSYPMVGVLPVVIELMPRPQGHGYMQVVVDTENPYLPKGARLRGHEFHYSRLVAQYPVRKTMLAVERGTGLGGGRDGIVSGRLFASYMHLFAPGVPSWAPALVRLARHARAHRLEEGVGHGQHHGGRASARSRRGWVHSGA